MGKRDNYRVNLIEAYDQPWKRKLEGTVGGHWGLFDAYTRDPKFVWGGSVSNHPHWRWQAAGGIAYAALVFAAAFAARRRQSQSVAPWLAVAAIAAVSGSLIGWTIRLVPIESLSAIDWIRSCCWVAVAFAAPIAGAIAIMKEMGVPTFESILGRRAGRLHDPIGLALGLSLIVLVVLAIQAALGLVFNPRYRDFPFAALTGAVAPFVLMMAAWPTRKDLRTNAETVAAGLLALCAIVIALSESFANWQALWFCAGLLALAISLLPGRAAPS
jgi:glucan 1,3-beta-glucosidase